MFSPNYKLQFLYQEISYVWDKLGDSGVLKKKKLQKIVVEYLTELSRGLFIQGFSNMGEKTYHNISILYQQMIIDTFLFVCFQYPKYCWTVTGPFLLYL